MTLELRGVRKSYGGVEVLHGISVTAEAGEIVAFVGANGAGKSTMIKVLSGAISADSGDVLIDGELLTLRSPHDAIEHGIRTVYQELTLVPELSVTENLLMGSLPRSSGLIDWRAAHKAAAELLDSIGFTGINPKTPARRLSVARQQMVEIAKALVTNPTVLILDEPSAVLAGADLDALFRLIRRLRDSGVLVLYVSHRLAEVLDLADRIVIMKDGAVVTERAPSETDQDDLIRLLAGREIAQIYPSRDRTAGEDVLVVDSLTRPGEFEDVSLTVRAGEVLGVFGLVGSGRSELVETIFGARRPASGSVSAAQPAQAFRRPATAIGRRVALVTEDRKRTGLVMQMSVRDNICLATLRGPFLDMRRLKKTSQDMIGQLAIQPPSCADKPVWQLSGGNQQKVVLAKWLLTKPRVLILDEPTRGVDMAARVEIYRMVDDLARSGVGVLLVSSDLDEVIGATDRILVMARGRVVGELDSASADEEEILAHSIGAKNGN